MKHALPLFTALLVTVTASGCAIGAPSGNAADTALSQRCKTVNSYSRIAIKTYDGKAASVCTVGGEDDCLYSRKYGKTYEHSTPDLNADGRADAVIKDFTGAYGQHEVIHFMAFAQCSDGNYIKVVDDMLQDLAVAASTGVDGWADLKVTRTCFNEALGDTQTRHFRLGFDRAQFRYGPPDNDPELSEFCSAKEMALPAVTKPPMD